PARADRHHQTWLRCRVVSLLEREFHVARHWPRHEEHIRVARGGDEVNPEAFEIIDGAVQADDFDFATIARAGVHFANVQGPSKDFVGAPFYLLTDGLDGLVFRG